MELLTNEITPQDPYQVKIGKLIDMAHISFLIHLYQPIIGPEAFSLFLTLRNHFSFQISGETSALQGHRQLANQMNIPFHIMMKARKTLEAVGLLRTTKYQHKIEDRCIIVYQLHSPLEPSEFFQSDILSILLLNRIGKNAYQELMTHLIPSEVMIDSQEFLKMEITKPFDEVFDSVLQSELMMKNESDINQFIQPISSNSTLNGGDIELKGKYLDIEFMKGMVSNLFHIDQIFTKANIRLFNELAFLYQLSEMDMIHLLHDQSIYDSSGILEENLLRKRIKEKLQYEQKEMLFIEKDTTPPPTSSIELQETKEGGREKRHHWILENYSPIQLLNEYQSGGKIPNADLVLIEGLLRDYQLPYQVVNVLLEYILLSNNYKLPKNLTEKIAGHWKRLKIKTVDEALKIAKNEHKLYKDWQEGSKKTTTATKNKERKPEKREKVPDYILNQKKKYHQGQKTPSKQEINLETEQEMKELLRKLGESEEGVKE